MVAGDAGEFVSDVEIGAGIQQGNGWTKWTVHYRLGPRGVFCDDTSPYVSAPIRRLTKGSTNVLGRASPSKRGGGARSGWLNNDAFAQSSRVPSRLPCILVRQGDREHGRLELVTGRGISVAVCAFALFVQLLRLGTGARHRRVRARELLIEVAHLPEARSQPLG